MDEESNYVHAMKVVELPINPWQHKQVAIFQMLSILENTRHKDYIIVGHSHADEVEEEVVSLCFLQNGFALFRDSPN